jgi:hypothetical protein
MPFAVSGFCCATDSLDSRLYNAWIIISPSLSSLSRRLVKMMESLFIGGHIIHHTRISIIRDAHRKAWSITLRLRVIGIGCD